ncbi:MAG: DUF2804 family protein [Deltaproteobacteria bacterium]|nr:DUF2804 family protein [Deltaproteobacteria bacterium]
MNALARAGDALIALAGAEPTVPARWAQVTIASGGLGVVVRLSQVGGIAAAETWIADLAAGRTWDERALSPIPHARFSLDVDAGTGHVLGGAGRVRLAARIGVGSELLVNLGGVLVDITLDARGAPEPMTITARETGRIMLRRHVGLTLTGRVRVGSEARAVEGTEAMIEVADLDLPRAIRWSSAALLGRPASYLSDLGPASAPIDNVAWTAGGARALGAADFALPEPGRPGRGPWTIGSRDDRGALAFTPRAVRTARAGLGAGTHAWVFGSLTGRVDEAVVDGAVGLCEARDWS